MATSLSEGPAAVPDELTDSAAIRESLQQPEQFAVLYDRYAAALHRYAGRRVGDEVADDLVAATFLAAFRARRRYDLTRASARPWLFGILTKEIARQHRTERARFRALQHAWSDGPVDRLADQVAADVSAQAGPAQFIYVKSVEAAAALNSGPGGRITSVHLHTDLQETWNSVSGTRNGLLREQARSAAAPGAWQAIALPGCRDGHPNPAPGAATALPDRCVPQPGYPAGLPKSGPAMLAYLYRNSHGQNPPAVQAFITAGDLIRESYVRPSALAALFAAVAQLSGVSVVQHAVNAAGQHGVAVQQTFRGISEQLIFSPRTHAFIGERQVAVSAKSGLSVGTVVDSTAILGLAVVDRAGQLPAHRG